MRRSAAGAARERRGLAAAAAAVEVAIDSVRVLCSVLISVFHFFPSLLSSLFLSCCVRVCLYVTVDV